MSSIYNPRYIAIIEALKGARQQRQITQAYLARSLGRQQSYVAKVEAMERRLDIIELFDWLQVLKYDLKEFFQDIGWLPKDPGIPIPIRGGVFEVDNGILQHLTWENGIKEVLLAGTTEKQYLHVEKEIISLFSSLNTAKPTLKNREAIARALQIAIEGMPDLNPSDIYQHVIYRLYIREYKRSTPQQSWVRAGGEAMELFVAEHYQPVLSAHNITITALVSTGAKATALGEMGLSDEVGGSKLDVALYASYQDQQVIFGGVHCKASLAERVSDDVPCSQAMMKKGYVSYLYTFDSKSFPPPQGDLVNRGELGSPGQPSDKRRYIEDHGSFDACFSYNLRTQPSSGETRSGKRIYVSSFKPDEDVFPSHVIQAWKKFKKDLQSK